MKHLYNKIYEAINTGIQKALALDDEDDISINYQHKKITNTPDILSNYVSKFLNTFNENMLEEIYNDIIYYYKQTNTQYIVKNIGELTLIYNQIRSLLIFGSIENIDLSWINTSNAALFILKDGSEISWNEINDSTNVEFIKIINSECGHPIIFHKNIKSSNNSMSWADNFHLFERPEKSDTYFNMENYNMSREEMKSYAKRDFDGYEHTSEILHNSNLKNACYYAAEYTVQQSSEGYTGYLPALGEIIFLSQYTRIIGLLLHIAKSQYNEWDLNEVFRKSLWTSTEYSQTQAYRFIFPNYADITNKGISCCKVLPLFKKNQL
ncbi:MAG: hypothetical protein [Wendovervirus sonii]|uniref:Uncharacterized protein n=1 Tax=phage Lak_Megaphage_Sonny TaxID=3109229 RepID=A0ABZ0Z4D7_9CAUD|nr:MAG: hypothetical protein [phage Lak_Megaphage_Sonny]